jgi:hypothetical protein
VFSVDFNQLLLLYVLLSFMLSAFLKFACTCVLQHVAWGRFLSEAPVALIGYWVEILSVELSRQISPQDSSPLHDRRPKLQKLGRS